MPYLVDGNNLCGAARDRRLGLPVDEAAMVACLSAFAERRAGWMTVVFDGPAGDRRGAARASRAGRLKVAFSGSGRIADDLIVEMAARSGVPADVIVVTSDRRLRARVRELGCRAIGCREFAGRVAAASAAAGEEKPLPGDVEAWERYFRGEE